jgi:hypothetical protein
VVEYKAVVLELVPAVAGMEERQITLVQTELLIPEVEEEVVETHLETVATAAPVS